MANRTKHPEPHVLRNLPKHPGLPMEPALEGDWYQLNLTPVLKSQGGKRWATLCLASASPIPLRKIVKGETVIDDPRNDWYAVHNERVKGGKPCQDPDCIHHSTVSRGREVTWERIERVRALELDSYLAVLLAACQLYGDQELAAVSLFPELYATSVNFGYGYVALGDHHEAYDPFDPSTFPDQPPALVQYPTKTEQGIEWVSKPKPVKGAK